MRLRLDFLGITEAAEKAGGDGKDAENRGLHCGIEMFFLAEVITVGSKESSGGVEADCIE